ncbi:putative RNA helicase [Coemansia sp. RSA 1722]|nr:putative RNA helicase [Coemansia sp. RSA 485]KAJ2606407.1 putative RNA helicase [Coemansia sp. RSA 1722]KAJ2635916.1 putative RNA helicase [Coemansia sp. RSA 1286]
MQQAHTSLQAVSDSTPEPVRRKVIINKTSPPSENPDNLQEEEEEEEMDGDEIKVSKLGTTTHEYPAPPMCTFQALGLDQWLVDSLKAMAITQPTEIQRACIQPILRGQDIIGGAKTGSGKTAAFALPILQQLSEDPYGIFAVILTPTRELAYQIAEQFTVLGKGVNIKVSVVIGGVDMIAQALELARRPHIVVATPGRLADHIESNNTMHLRGVRYLVLDEADRLLTDTFAPDLAVIMKAIPRERQTLLFTATMTESILALRDRPRKQADGNSQRPFVHLCDTREGSTVSSLVQNYIFVPSHVKEAYLVHLLMSNVSKLEKRSNSLLADDNSDDDETSDTKPLGTDKSIIIFVGQCKTAETLRVMLFELGFRVTALHSKMPQQERLASLGKFRAQVVRILIATDVGSRGLDIPSVEMVINMHVPRDPDEYVHRVGRTARAGRGGRAVTIMSERDIKLIHNIEARVGKQMEELRLSESKVLEGMGKVLAAKRAAALHLLDIDFGARDKIRMKKRGADAANTGSNARHKPNKKRN